MVVVFMMMFMFVIVVILMFMLMSPVKIFHIVVMAFMFAVQYDIEITCIDTCFLNARYLYLITFQRQSLEHIQKLLLIGSQIQKGCHHHVTRDT